MADAWAFLQRGYPNANCVLLHGPRPVLVDTGHPGDVDSLLVWLAAQGVQPAQLSLVVNTHFHSDHVGGNPVFQALGVPIAASRLEAGLVNRRDPRACDGVWLSQTVHPYRVDRSLDPGETIDTGLLTWRVIPTPPHAPGHISLHAEAAGLLVVGDLFHANDVGWIPPPSRYPDAIGAAEASLESVRALAPRAALSGHGGPIDDPVAAATTALRRVRAWRADPAQAAWHACKRNLAHKLILAGSMSPAEAAAELLDHAWFPTFAADWLGGEAEALVPQMLAALQKAGAVLRDGRLFPTAPIATLKPGWDAGAAYPPDWPPL
jgi:glyoxylase-like metal-dependent hydrolase (beta-lactamase superfamily II)